MRGFFVVEVKMGKDNKISYQSGTLENLEIRKTIITILEGKISVY